MWILHNQLYLHPAFNQGAHPHVKLEICQIYQQKYKERKKEIGGMPNMVNGITLAVDSSKNFTDLEIVFVISTHGCKRQIGGIDS